MDTQKILLDYSENKSIWKTGKLHGIAGQKIHFILNQNGIDTTRVGEYSEQEIVELTKIYDNGFKSGDGTLDAFCKKYNRLKSNVCRKAKRLKLAISSERKCTEKRCGQISINAKKRIAEKGHPKGMLGKEHSEQTKAKSSIRAKKMWADPNSKVNTQEHRQLLSDNASKNANFRLDSSKNVYSRSKKGTITIGGKTIFARYTWESNVASYFEFLKNNKEIKDWEHEPKTFWFLAIKRGVRSYKPDFLITKNDGSQYYEEVKGWMDDKSKTKLNRMRIYYPEIEVRVLGQDRYKSISKNKSFIPNWGLLDAK